MLEEQLHMVIGTILSVEKVAGSDRLFLVRVDAGEANYQIATSLAFFFQPQELVGLQIPLKIDVEPKIIRGVYSDARLIAVMNDNQRPVLLVPQRSVYNGAVII
jgi:methionyl-tRNA synthetase